MGLFGGDPHDSTTLERMGLDALETSTGQVLGAVAGDAFASSPLVRLGRAQASSQTPFVNEYGMNMAPDLPPSPLLDPADANKRYGIKGALNFTAPVTEAVAQDLFEAKRDQIARQDIVDRRTDSIATGWAARTGTALAVGLLDPLNLAAGFIPVLGEARAAEWFAKAGSAATRAGVRAGIGALQGGASMIPLEGINYALDQHELNDWTMGEALHNIAFGSIVGGGLHVLTRYPRAPITQLIEDAGPDARAGALQAGIAQHLADAPTAVAPVLDIGRLESGMAARIRARGDTADGNYAAFTPQGLRVEMRPEVVELDSLVASHDDTGNVNPAYPHAEGLQVRDRANAASQAQITEMASRLEPERLGPSPEAATGAPIVNGDNIVESGNGRTMALRRVYGDPVLTDQAAAYRAFLRARGHDVEGMKAPVLIGRRVTDLPPDQVKAFTDGANERTTLGLNAGEQARMDAKRAGAAVSAWQPGTLAGRENQDFVGAFMAQVPAEERAGMIETNGALSPAGEARIRAAMLAHAYGDAIGPTLERMLNGRVEHMKGLAGALTDMAGPWSRMRAAAAAGDIPAGLDITPALGEAVQLLDQARAARESPATILAQTDMLSRPSPAGVALLRMMFRDDAMRQPVGRAKLGETLGHYVDQAMEARPGPNLFGDPETTAGDILRTSVDAKAQAVADALGDAAAPRSAERPADVAASRDAADQARAASASHAGDGAEASLFGDAPEAPKAPEEATGVKTETPPAKTSPEQPAPAQADMFGGAPPAAAKLSPEIQEAMRLADEAAAALHTELAAGRLTEADMAPLHAADEAVARAEIRAQAAEAAASCIVSGLGEIGA